jgi:hypothetical protein
MASGLRDVFAASRAEMVKSDTFGVAQAFQDAFDMREGDYLEVLMNDGLRWQPCRILSVDQCYVNAGGGYTARLNVARLLATGRVGVGRSLTLVRKSNGKLSVLGGTVMTRVGNVRRMGAKS